MQEEIEYKNNKVYFAIYKWYNDGPFEVLGTLTGAVVTALRF